MRWDAPLAQAVRAASQGPRADLVAPGSPPQRRFAGRVVVGRLGEDRRRCAFPLLRATRYAIAQGVQPSPAPGLIHALSHVSLRARDSCSGWRARTIRCHWLTAGASSGARRRTGGLNFLLIHEAQQGCRDATYEPSRFPVAVPYPSPHRATPAYVVVTSSDLDTSRNKASVSGLSWISRLNFDGVGVDTVSTVVAEAHERFPLVVEIAHRLAQRARRRHLGYGAVEPSAYRVEHPDALGLLGPPNPYPQCRPNRTFTGSARPLLPGWTNADM